MKNNADAINGILPECIDTNYEIPKRFFPFLNIKIGAIN